jgi:hypothetical protein
LIVIQVELGEFCNDRVGVLGEEGEFGKMWKHVRVAITAKVLDCCLQGRLAKMICRHLGCCTEG